MNFENILKEAFAYWKSAMRYNILFSLMYFGLFLTFLMTLGTYTGVWEQIMKLLPSVQKNPEIYIQRVEALIRTEMFVTFSLMLTVCKGLIYPFHIGMFEIYKKMDKKEETFVSDLFVGYLGINFFKYASYFICWIFIYNFAVTMFYFPGILWIMFTLFVTPLMFLRNEALGLAFVGSFKAVKNNFLTVFLAVLIGGAFTYAGVFLFWIGYILTFPFWTALIYVLYKNVFREEIKTENL